MKDGLLEPKDVVRGLKGALIELGDYVYGYYRPDKASPFYVGKGRGPRALIHWKAACRGDKTHKQYEGIAEILKNGRPPILKFISYNLRDTKKDDVYTVVERSLQSAFGIQMIWNKTAGKDRLVPREGSLVQKRNDLKNHPVLSLEAAICRQANKPRKEIAPADIAFTEPTLLVGLSKTYDPGYSEEELAEMARMWWKLEKFGTKFRQLQQSRELILAAWSSKFGTPQIVGVWRVVQGSFVRSDSRPDRLRCNVYKDYALQREWLGVCLAGSGQSFEGPRIYLPNKSKS